ncbi:MAG TPA: thioesterase family protein, partial [Halococcus sp.]|nr:thioesterase family protein [Halococcus sp.]
TYSDSFHIRRPLIEGSDLAYFEEYPRLATIALERYLEAQGVSLAGTSDEYPFRLRRWEWNFNAPVAYGTTLDVNATVVDTSEESVLVFHTFEQDGRTLIDGWTEYGCFNRTGAQIAFDDHIRNVLSEE